MARKTMQGRQSKCIATEQEYVFEVSTLLLKLPLLRNDYLKVFFTRGNILRNQPHYVQISYMIMFKLSPHPHCVLPKIMDDAKNRRQELPRMGLRALDCDKG